MCGLDRSSSGDLSPTERSHLVCVCFSRRRQVFQGRATFLFCAVRSSAQARWREPEHDGAAGDQLAARRDQGSTYARLWAVFLCRPCAAGTRPRDCHLCFPVHKFLHRDARKGVRS